MKKTILVISMILIAVFSVSAMNVDLSVDGKLNGFQFSTERPVKNAITDEKTYLMTMDLGINARTAFFANNGHGAYVNVGYDLKVTGTDEFNKPLHGLATGIGYNYKINPQKTWSFVIGTGFNINYNFNTEHLKMSYQVNLDANYNISKKAFIKLGLGYNLEFLDAYQKLLTDEWVTDTYDKHTLLVPAIGAGIKF